MATSIDIVAREAAGSATGRPDPGRAGVPAVLDEIEIEARRLEALAQAPRTQVAYNAAWRHFEDWCRGVGLTALPADVATIRRYVTTLSKTTVPNSKPPRLYSVATLEQRLAAIKKCHFVASFGLDLSPLAELRKGNRRDKAKKLSRKRKEPLLDTHIVEILRRMTGALPDLRDRVILLLGFVGGLRRAEIAGIDIEHIEFVAGGAKIHLPESKGDRDAKGVEVNLIKSNRQILCPVRAIKDWLAASGLEDGPLLRSIDRFGYFGEGRLTPGSIRLIVMGRAAAAGFAKNVSTHSLRRGAVTTALQRGAAIEKVARHVRHKSIQTTMGYYDDATGIKDNVMHAVLDVANPDDPPPPVPVKRGERSLPRAEIIDFSETAAPLGPPIKIDRLKNNPVDLAPLNESMATVDEVSKRVATKLGVAP